MKAYCAVMLCACGVSASEGRPPPPNGGRGKPPNKPPNGPNTPPPPAGHTTASPTSPVAPVSPALQGCKQRCSDAGHCCTGENSTNNQPSCGQGCIVAEYYISQAVGDAKSPQAIKAAIQQCKDTCWANGGQKKVCQWNQGPKGKPFPHQFAKFDNCQKECIKDPQFPHAICNAQDSWHGRECDEGCTYFLDPEKPVCAESQNNFGCVHKAGAAPFLCNPNACNDWPSCQDWCESKNNGTVGCCSFDSKKRQCSFGPTDDGFTLQTGVQGSQASLCAPFDVGAAGGGDGSSGGFTGGAVFLIIFFAGGMTYFSAGFAYQYVKQEKRGVEAIPNVEFWKDLPHLVKDGAMYSAHQVRSKVATVRGYTSV